MLEKRRRSTPSRNITSAPNMSRERGEEDGCGRWPSARCDAEAAHKFGGRRHGYFTEDSALEGKKVKDRGRRRPEGEKGRKCHQNAVDSVVASVPRKRGKGGGELSMLLSREGEITRGERDTASSPSSTPGEKKGKSA